MTLALLLTAVGGAWAQGLDVVDYTIRVDFYDNYIPDETRFMCEIRNMTDPEAEIKGTLYLSVDGDLKGTFPVNGEMFMDRFDPLDAGNHTWSAEFIPEGGGSFKRDGHFTINKAIPTIYNESSTSINLGVGESTEVEVYIMPTQAGELSYSSSDASVASITKKEYSNNYIIEAKAAGTSTITFSFAGNTNYEAVEDVKITVTVSTPPIEVTIADGNGEASFDMPTSDVTVNYELVRDMSVQMTATMGDGTDGLRYRVKKSEKYPGKYEPADMDMMQVLGLVAVNDGIEQKDLTLDEDYFCRIYKLDEQTLQPEGDGVKLFEFDFAPGLYALKAFATDGSNYDGETALSNTFKLFEGYELKIAAGEYATYYKDEALKLEDADKQSIELYTVSSISNDKAVLSQACDAMPKNTPMLVYNKGSEDKTFLLIPCNDPDLALTVAPEFKGTLTATTIAASTANQTNYAFNGKQFVWVKDAINIGANKAWLSIENANARAINIVFDETTGLKTVDSLQFTVDSWYTIDGRKLQGKPTKKGMYILNGKKVVVK